MAALSATAGVVGRTCTAHCAVGDRGEAKVCSVAAASSASLGALQSLGGSAALVAATRTCKTAAATRRASAGAARRQAIVCSVAATPNVSTRSQSTEVRGKPTILVAEKLGEAGLELLKGIANVDCSYNLSQEELCAKISLCDALIVRSGTKVTREVFEASKGRLKVVGRAGVGIDNVDLQAATEVGCLVVNAPTANTIAAAEHGIALLTALSRNVAQASASLKAGQFPLPCFSALIINLIRSRACFRAITQDPDDFPSFSIFACIAIVHHIPAVVLRSWTNLSWGSKLSSLFNVLKNVRIPSPLRCGTD